MAFQLSKFYSTLKKRITRNDFIKSVFTLSSGVAISQGIALLTTPVVSRIYDISAIGDFSLVVSSAAILSSVVGLSLTPAIMLPQEEKDAQHICTSTLLFVSIGMTVILAVLFLLADRWKLFQVTTNYYVACIVLCTFVVLSSTSNLYYTYANRRKLYGVLFWNPMLGTISNAGISIIFGLLGWGMVGYALGNITALLLNILYMHHYIRPFSLVGNRPFKILQKYKKFPLFQLPADLIETVAQQVPIQIISMLHGSVTLGLYSMCMTIIQLPIKFFAIPISNVLFKELTSRYHEGTDIGDFTFKVLSSSIRLAIIPLATLSIFGEPLFAFALGEPWRKAGEFAAILSISELLHFSNVCLSRKYLIIGKQQVNLLFSAVRILLNIIVALFSKTSSLSIQSTLYLLSTANILFFTIDIGLFLHYMKVPAVRYIRFLACYIFVPMGGIVLLRTILMRFYVL